VPLLVTYRQVQPERAGQQAVIENDPEQGEADHEHAGDRTRLERQGKTGAEAALRRFRRAHIGADRHEHADETCSARQDGAEDEADSGHPAEQNEQNDGNNGADNGDRPVLALQVGVRAFLNGQGYFTHSCVA